VLGVFWFSAIERDPARHHAAMAELFALYRDGKIRPSIWRTFPLAQAGEAIAALGLRTTTGKVVVTV
jgi:NADPH2:quinone reductase